MRAPYEVPRVQLPASAAEDQATFTVPLDAVPRSQRTAFGTTAWAESYGRRNRSEAINSLLKETFVRINRGHFRVMCLAKITILTAFTLAGLNLTQTGNFCSRHGLDPATGQPEAAP